MNPIAIFAVAAAIGVFFAWAPAGAAAVGPGPMRATVSKSKLGLHLIGRYTPAARKITRARPPVLKVLDPQASAAMQEALVDYKKHCPDGWTVMRVWERTSSVHFTMKDDPDHAAVTFMERVLAPALRRLPREAAACVDFLEGPNEGENCPTWAGVKTAAWYGRFCATLCAEIAGAGFRPCIGAVAVGNPPGSPAEIQAKIEAFTPALAAVKRFRGAWAYHAYTIQYTMDPEVESWYALRYRRFYRYLRKHHPNLADIPMILTEAGVDRRGDRLHDGWQARGSAEKFQGWLTWFDTQIQKDPYILGATLFQSGDTAGWPSFDVDPVADWLARHIRGN